MDLEVGLPEAINLKVADWSHVQELDYEKLPFKCRFCHGYGHFARSCKKNVEDEAIKEKGDQWTQVQKNTSTKKETKLRDKEEKWGQATNPSDRNKKKMEQQ